MNLPPAHTALLFGVAFLAGAVNSIAGGGSLLTFAALILSGVPPIFANTTSTLALLPGSVSSLWGFRRELTGHTRLLLVVGLPSLLGGVLGACSLLALGAQRFAFLVPWLLVGTTTLFAAQEVLARTLSPSESRVPARPAVLVVVALVQLAIASYGGFFGSGMGILMLATFGLAGVASIHQRNALKHVAAVCINGPAALIFILKGCVLPGPALLMMVAAVGGGYGGARLALWVGSHAVRRTILLVNLVLTVAAFWRMLG